MLIKSNMPNLPNLHCGNKDRSRRVVLLSLTHWRPRLVSKDWCYNINRDGSNNRAFGIWGIASFGTRLTLLDEEIGHGVFFELWQSWTQAHNSPQSPCRPHAFPRVRLLGFRWTGYPKPRRGKLLFSAAAGGWHFGISENKFTWHLRKLDYFVVNY